MLLRALRARAFFSNPDRRYVATVHRAAARDDRERLEHMTKLKKHES